MAVTFATIATDAYMPQGLRTDLIQEYQSGSPATTVLYVPLITRTGVADEIRIYKSTNKGTTWSQVGGAVAPCYSGVSGTGGFTYHAYAVKRDFINDTYLYILHLSTLKTIAMSIFDMDTETMVITANDSGYDGWAKWTDGSDQGFANLSLQRGASVSLLCAWQGQMETPVLNERDKVSYAFYNIFTDTFSSVTVYGTGEDRTDFLLDTVTQVVSGTVIGPYFALFDFTNLRLTRISVSPPEFTLNSSNGSMIADIAPEEAHIASTWAIAAPLQFYSDKLFLWNIAQLSSPAATPVIEVCNLNVVTPYKNQFDIDVSTGRGGESYPTAIYLDSCGGVHCFYFMIEAVTGEGNWVLTYRKRAFLGWDAGGKITVFNYDGAGTPPQIIYPLRMSAKGMSYNPSVVGFVQEWWDGSSSWIFEGTKYFKYSVELGDPCAAAGGDTDTAVGCVYYGH